MWKCGRLNTKFDQEFKKFEYCRYPLNLKEEQDWKLSPYNTMTFGGAMYGGENKMPEWTKNAAKEIGLYKCGFSFYKMQTNNIIPEHVDHFSVYTKLFNEKICNVFRALIFLEDWKSGHYFEIDKTPIVNYKKGDYIIWSHEVPHFAANIGIEDRFTLQITGLKINDLS